MALPSSKNTKESQSFVELADGNVARRVLASGIMSGIEFDYIGVTQNSDNDVYVYKTGGSGGTTIATVTVTFTDTNKTDLQSVART